ncbi:cache domain-containing sensor histidine kinase [Paenibacillus agricola]|uniref:Histidine kinase n=1 Tax=Paenibacillus agricola TaxID=2716264 RepID=A0ABX0JAC4_9BACL|nr:histidine kinase [Paenibacillus agricola]NHN32179.1 histidine kinase [Paenibacillus agricola]
MDWVGRIIKWLRNQSLERKVFVMTSVVILLAVPLTGAFSFYQASTKLEGYAYQAADTTANQLSGYMNNELRNVSDKLYLINTSRELQQTIDWSQNKSNATFSEMFNAMFSLFANVSLTSGTIRSIYLYTPKGEFYEGHPVERLNISFKDTPYYQAIKTSSLNRWVYLPKDPLFAEKGDVISLVTRPAGDTISLGLDNYLVITLSASQFIRNLQSIQLVPEGFSMILDEQGRPILTSSGGSAVEALMKQGSIGHLDEKAASFDMSINGKTYLVNHKPIPFLGWQALIFQPKVRLLEQIAYIQYFTLLMTAVMLILSFFMNKYIARWVTNPIRRLQKLMGQAKQGNLHVRFTSDTRDEIGELGSRFDEMLERIQELLHQVVEEGHAKRQAEMRALQAQINPHFLYNTLDEIYWKALDFHDKTAADIILSLSRFFRLSLNQGEEPTTVAKEMEHVSHYLKLVNYQYQRQFSFEVHTEERTKGVLVSKIILQPLAENSVLHAFKANEYKDFRIRVSSRWEESGMVILEVEDNGSGMPVELVERFNRPFEENRDQPVSIDSRKGEGYAIMNIKQRLHYFFGDQASMHVQSHLGEGTRFEIRILSGEEEE